MRKKQRFEKRKVMLLAPLLVVPFLCLGFYAMGGGTGGNEKDTVTATGINTQLPDASFKNEEKKDKFGLYEEAGADSPSTANAVQAVADRLGFGQENQQTREIDRKLEALNKEINKPVEPNGRPATATKVVSPTGMKSDVDRLEMLMKNMQATKGEDPEMAQLNGLMQNILELQHPELAQQRYRQQKNLSPDSQFRAIPAIIVDNQKAVQGATVKLRLLDSLRINGVSIPKGHELFGTCRLTNQRLLLDIRNIRMGTSIVPVDLSVYSLDGMEGIYAPEAMLSDALNSGTDNAVRGVNLIGLDASLGAQVAGAGIDAAKGLISRRVSRIKVKLQGGKKILLRNNKPDTFTKY